MFIEIIIIDEKGYVRIAGHAKGHDSTCENQISRYFLQ